jgi:hypothetical protein
MIQQFRPIAVIFEYSLVAALLQGCGASKGISLDDMKPDTRLQKAYYAQASAARRSLGLRALYQDRGRPGRKSAYVLVTVAEVPPPGSLGADGLEVRTVDVLPLGDGHADIRLGLDAQRTYTWPISITIKDKGKPVADAIQAVETEGAPIYGQRETTPEEDTSPPHAPKLRWKFVARGESMIASYRYRQDLYKNGRWAGTLFGR